MEVNRGKYAGRDSNKQVQQTVSAGTRQGLAEARSPYGGDVEAEGPGGGQGK